MNLTEVVINQTTAELEQRLLQCTHSHDELDAALSYAVWKEDPGKVALLLQSGANPNSNASGEVIASVYLAAETNSTEILKLLLEYGGDITFRASDGGGLLHAAVEGMADQARQTRTSPDLSTILLLIERGVSLAVVTADGKTALDLSRDFDFLDAAHVIEQAQRNEERES